ncbi:uncharacterized protein LTR77_006781 [Saxophila tyrrhenica]|uniref:FHA domain-containing protein n=1 Tax=Saxophila tyrrhenica TaxID=1690608 RepID=A0AAV9P5W4_9PEZI|nr:hypothetical protein LTR77_006781 [Saxophila tyrrhenica]
MPIDLQHSQSHLTTAPPPLPPRPTLDITLTAAKSPSDVRTITLYRHDPIVIGRASRSRDKNLEPSPSNTLFDCPVVSRYHADLELIRRPPPLDDAVIIKDIGSMHGTKVNDRILEEGEERLLKNGDRIKLGEKVTRGDDSHDGVELIYASMNPGDSQTSYTMRASQPTGTFRVPSPEADDSDVHSVGGASVSERNQSSSAKTTPEQGQVKLGSQQQPINLDDAVKTRPEATGSRTDAEILLSQPSHTRKSPPRPTISIPRHQDSNRVVPDTFEDNNDYYQSASVHDPQSANYIPLLSSYEEPEKHYDESNWGSQSDAGFDDYSSDGNLYDGRDVSEDENECVEKQPSPELGSPDDFARSSYPTRESHPGVWPARSDSYGCFATRSASQQSQPATKPAPSHTYAPPPSAFNASAYYGSGLRTDYRNSSRWDVEPSAFSVRPYAAQDDRAPSYGQPAFGFGSVTGAPRPKTSPFSPLTPENVTSIQPNVFGHRFDGPITWTGPAYDMATGPTQRPFGSAGAFQSQEANAPTTSNKINISDIVENNTSTKMSTEPQPSAKPAQSVGDLLAGARADIIDANAMTASAFNQALLTAAEALKARSSGKKRKADDTADDMADSIPNESINLDELASPVSPTNPSGLTSFTSVRDADIVAPPAKKIKTAPKKKIAVTKKKSRVATAAKIAGGTVGGMVMGGVATMAFLCSPLAERAIEWLA